MNRLIDVLNMGGYGAYVWPAYLACAISLIGIALASYLALAKARKQLQNLQETDET